MNTGHFSKRMINCEEISTLAGSLHPLSLFANALAI